MEMDDIEQRVTEMMELDEENEADSRLEDDDQVMEVITIVKDDMLMVVEMDDCPVGPNNLSRGGGCSWIN